MLDSLDAKGIKWGNYAGSLSTFLLFSAQQDATIELHEEAYPFAQFADRRGERQAATGHVPGSEPLPGGL